MEAAGMLALAHWFTAFGEDTLQGAPILAGISFIWDTFGNGGILALFEMRRPETK